MNNEIGNPNELSKFIVGGNPNSLEADVHVLGTLEGSLGGPDTHLDIAFQLLAAPERDPISVGDDASPVAIDIAFGDPGGTPASAIDDAAVAALKQKGLELDVNLPPLPGQDEIVFSVDGTPVLTADVTPTETTINLAGTPSIQIEGDLTHLLPALNVFEERVFDTLSHADLKNLKFTFDWSGVGTPEENIASLELVIDSPSPQQEDTVLFSADITAGDPISIVDFIYPSDVTIAVTADLSELYPYLQILDILV
jgi:hypothetical protein